MIRRILNAVRPQKLSEANALIQQACAFERYSEHKFTYKNFAFEVSDFLSVAWQLKEYFEDQRLNFVSASGSPRIIDCGANVGVSVLYFKHLFPKAVISAYEPDPNIYKYLVKNMKANTVKDVELINKAVWINNEGIEFGSEGADSGSLYFEGNKISLPSQRLREVLALEQKVDLLKMDIEGTEVDVILDCNDLLKKVKYLFVEYHSWKKNEQSLQQMLDVLTKNGFRYYIHSIGHQSEKPFMGIDSYNGMDVQLDIYAVNETAKT